MKQCAMTCNRDIEFLLTPVEDDPLLIFTAEVDWEGFREILERIWQGNRSNYPAGHEACDVVLMFKLLALGSLNNASFAKIQKNATADNTWRRFLEFDSIELPPDKNTIWAYADALAKSGQMDQLFDSFLAQMAAAGYTPEEG